MEKKKDSLPRNGVDKPRFLPEEVIFHLIQKTVQNGEKALIQNMKLLEKYTRDTLQDIVIGNAFLN